MEHVPSGIEITAFAHRPRLTAVGMAANMASGKSPNRNYSLRTSAEGCIDESKSYRFDSGCFGFVFRRPFLSLGVCLARGETCTRFRQFVFPVHTRPYTQLVRQRHNYGRRHLPRRPRLHMLLRLQ